MDADCSLFFIQIGHLYRSRAVTRRYDQAILSEDWLHGMLNPPFAIPKDISYLKLIPIPRHTSEDNHYLQLVRSGVRVKLPTITYDKVASSALSIVGGPYIPNALIAILPLSHKRYETWVFGIVLNRLQAVGFLRPAKSLLLLSRVWVGRLRHVSERLIMTVRDEAPISSSGANRTGLQRVAFHFHRPSFKVEIWFSYLTPDTARISSGPCARFY
jgi:hypothetical protein